MNADQMREKLADAVDRVFGGGQTLLDLIMDYPGRELVFYFRRAPALVDLNILEGMVTALHESLVGRADRAEKIYNAKYVVRVRLVSLSDPTTAADVLRRLEDYDARYLAVYEDGRKRVELTKGNTGPSVYIRTEEGKPSSAPGSRWFALCEIRKWGIANWVVVYNEEASDSAAESYTQEQTMAPSVDDVLGWLDDSTVDYIQVVDGRGDMLARLYLDCHGHYARSWPGISGFTCTKAVARDFIESYGVEHWRKVGNRTPEEMLLMALGNPAIDRIEYLNRPDYIIIRRTEATYTIIRMGSVAYASEADSVLNVIRWYPVENWRTINREQTDE